MTFSGTEKYKDTGGFIYSILKNVSKKMLLICEGNNCVVSAEINKDTNQVTYVGVHHHEQATQNNIRIAQLTAYLKSAARQSSDSGNKLFKEAIAKEFKDVLLPPEFKSKMLESIRNMRKYKSKKNKNSKVNEIQSIQEKLVEDTDLQEVSIQHFIWNLCVL